MIRDRIIGLPGESFQNDHHESMVMNSLIMKLLIKIIYVLILTCQTFCESRYAASFNLLFEAFSVFPFDGGIVDYKECYHTL